MMRFTSPLKSYTYLNNSLTITYIKEGSGELVWKNGNQKRVKIHNNRYVVVNADCGWDYVNRFQEYLDVLSLVISKDLQNQLNYYMEASEIQLLDRPFDQVEGDFFYLEHALNADYNKVGRFLKSIHTNSLFDSFSYLSPEEMTLELYRLLYEETTHVVSSAHRIKVKKKSTQIETFKRLMLAREYIEENLTNPISLQDISEVSSLSKYHVYDSFKRVYGKTPHQYINAVKIDRSKALLEKGSLSVAEIAAMLGFSDYSVFSKLFKKINGVAPSKFS